MLNIYPPILLSTQVAFLTSETNYPIYFTLSNVTSFSSVGHILIRIVRQSNNRTIVNTNTYPDGTIYKNKSAVTYNAVTLVYSISINRSDLAESWQAGYLYKVQLRFGTTNDINSWLGNKAYFSTWKLNLINNLTFSEWSTVMIIKAISPPDISIENAAATSVDIVSSERSEPSLHPLFTGYCVLDNASKEMVDTYKFDLFSGNDIEDPATLLESSGWLRHEVKGADSGDKYRFKIMLTNNSKYTVTYSIRTINGFEISQTVNTDKMPVYTFTAMQTYLAALEDITLTAIDSDVYCRENGVIRLYLNSAIEFSGDFVISRASEATNFTVYEDLKYLIFSKLSLDNFLAYDDYTIESGVRYRYALQQENAAGIRTDPIYSADTTSHKVDFDYSYLYRDGVQLKLKFDQKLNSFKHTTLRNKLDTLGDKYPHLTLNGNAYYAEFPIGGLISLHMDNDETFFTSGPNGLYYKDELIIPGERFLDRTGQHEYSVDHARSNWDHKSGYDFNDENYAYGNDETASEEQLTEGTERPVDLTKVVVNPSEFHHTTDLVPDNVFIERKFREKVEEFLNDFNYKLYRSPTEGNIVVGLLNVSLTPKVELGRMLYEFSATAYEVLEDDVANLNEFGIIDIGEFTSLASDAITLSFGQVVWDMTKLDKPLQYGRGNVGLYNSNVGASTTDIYGLIKQLEEISIGGGYKFSLKRVTSMWVEPYPDLDFTTEELEIKATWADLLNAGVSANDERVIALTNELAEYEKLRTAVSGPAGTTIITVNGARIIMLPHKIYQLTENVRSINLVAAARPIIVNYICELTQTEDTSVGIVSAIDASRIWGLIAGVFTDSDRVLKTYNYNYKDLATYRIYNTRPDATVVRDALGNVIVDNTNINVYKTVNLFDIVKQEVLKLVELMYSTKFRENENGELTDGTIYYSFSDMMLFDIEADPGTFLRVGKSSDGSDAINVLIGPTGHYTLNPMTSLVRYVALERQDALGKIISKPQFAIINYKCLTNQMTMVYIGG